MTGARRSLVGAAAGLLLGAVAAAVTGGQAWAAADVVDDADIALTDGAGPAVATFKVRGRTLTKVVSRAEDGASAGVYRAVLAAGDALPRDLAAVAGVGQKIAPPADSPAASFVLRRASGETRITTARPPSDAAAARVLAALERQRQKPVATLKIAVLPWSASAGDAPRSVTVRLTADGVPGAEVRLNAGDLSLQMAEERPQVAGVTPLPPEWLPISEPAPGPAFRVLKLGKSLDIPLRAAIPATGAFSVRAALAGTVVLRVPSASAEELAMTLTSRPAAGRSRR